MTHLPTPKYKKWAISSCARDSHIAILAYSDRNPPYIDLLHLCFSSKLFHVLRYKWKTEEKVRERYTCSTGQVEKKKQGTQAVATSHNITINNKLNLHYLQNLFQLKRKKKSNLVQNVFLYSQILRRAE